MIPKVIFFLLVSLALAGCSGVAFGKCESFVDDSLANREFTPDSGKLRLVLEADQTELPSSRKPVAVFLVPDSVAAASGYRADLIQEKIDAQSEAGKRVMAAIRDNLDVSRGGCHIKDDLSVSGCAVVMGTMTGRIGNCCATYPLAYEATITFPNAAQVDAQVFAAIAILDEDARGRIGCVQVISP